MNTHSQTLSAAHVTLQGFVHDILQRIAAAAAERRVRRQQKAAAEALRHMDLRLLDDIGVTSSDKGLPLEQLALLTPAVLAANIFSGSSRNSR
jgi:uncharacterized protein YjiS (DUF1127 family)